MFLDASAILALLLDETEAGHLAMRIEQATSRLSTSPIGVLESVINYARIKGVTLEVAGERIDEFLQILKVETISITPEIGHGAIRAYAEYGKGSGHPAQLNLGDVFAYACAKNQRVPLLYKGNDFVHTDLG
jgi:ribonuclease VapC